MKTYDRKGGPLLFFSLGISSLFLLGGCGHSAASDSAKTPDQVKAFKGSPPPPDVQREIDKTMAQLRQKGQHGTQGQ